MLLRGEELRINFLPNEKKKILAFTKLKAFADNIFNGAKMIISVSDSVENIVGKGENTGYHHFPLFPQSFQKTSSSGAI